MRRRRCDGCGKPAKLKVRLHGSETPLQRVLAVFRRKRRLCTDCLLKFAAKRYLRQV